LVTLCCINDRWLRGNGVSVEWYWQRNTETVGENLVPLLLPPPQVLCALAWDWSQIFIERWTINCLSNCVCMLIDGQISAVKWLCAVHNFSQTYLGIWKRNKEGTLFCSIWWKCVLRSSCILQIWGSIIRVDSTFLETRLKFLLC
jgi:hypothetical protein